MIKKIVVTGGSGTAGRAVVADLLEHGYDVLNIDREPPPERISPFLEVDLLDQGQVFEALWRAEGVVHMGAIPAPGIVTDERTFRNNNDSTFNIFNAAMKLGLQRVVWASSMRVIGVPYPDGLMPHYFPVDEEHPYLPDSTYSLSKVVSEEMARQFARWSGIPFVGLRFSHVVRPEIYPQFLTSRYDNPVWRRELWGYVDARDAALSCRLGLEAEIQGAEAFNITAADCAIERKGRTLLDQYYPGVPLREELPDDVTLFSLKKAERLLGYHPRYSWRDHV